MAEAVKMRRLTHPHCNSAMYSVEHTLQLGPSHVVGQRQSVQFHLPVNRASAMRCSGFAICKTVESLYSVKVNRNSKMHVRKMAEVSNFTSTLDSFIFFKRKLW